jgi:hypothetical protein
MSATPPPPFTQADMTALWGLLRKAWAAGWWEWLLREIAKISPAFGPTLPAPQPAPGNPPPIPPPIVPLVGRREAGEAAD